jgi:Skp family chaperone for outer membrane proteins
MKHHDVRWALGLGVLACALGASSGARADKLAFVDMKRAVQDSSKGKSALAKLQGEIEAKQKEFGQRRDELSKEEEALGKEASSLAPDVLAKKRQELRQKVTALQEAAGKFRREVQDEELKLTRPIISTAMRAIEIISNREKFTAVLRKEALLWPQSSAADITNEVIRMIDQAASGAAKGE